MITKYYNNKNNESVTVDKLTLKELIKHAQIFSRKINRLIDKILDCEPGTFTAGFEFNLRATQSYLSEVLAEIEKRIKEK